MKMSFVVKSLVSVALSAAKQAVKNRLTPSYQKPIETIIVAPTVSELKLRTEEFDRHQMAATMKELESAIYHLSNRVSDLIAQTKSSEEMLVCLTTSHEELLHSLDMSSSNRENEDYIDNESLQQQNDEDEVALNQLWNENAAKKGNTLN